MAENKDIKLVRRTYDAVAEQYNDLVAENSSYPNHLELLATYLEPRSRVLDVGCGTGEAIGYLIKKGFIGTGIDFSRSMLDIAKRRFPRGEFLELDFTKTDIPGTYDAFIAYLSLVYTPHDQLPHLLRKISKSLNKQGLFQIAMLMGDDSQVDQNFWDTGKPMYFFNYSEEDLISIIRDLSFEVLNMVTQINRYKTIEEQTIYVTGRVP